MAARIMSLCAGMVCVVFALSAVGQVKVRGYYRKDGKYVAPHYRSEPNNTTNDNYSARGNVNPYTGEAGHTRPRDAFTSGTSSYQVQAQPAAPQTSIVPAVETYLVYRCTDAQGGRHYLSYPRAGCDAILAPVEAPQATVAPLKPQQFGGYHRTSDCSGHRAGYEWAAQRGIESPNQCSGQSQSFIEGCRAYADEQQAHAEPDY